MNRAFVSLGSNIDKEENLPAAGALLAEMSQLLAFSRVYETLPVGLEDQPNFFNAAVLILTPLSALALKEQVLSKVEQTLHRERHAEKNAPRTIDVDLALFNDDILEYDGHRVPDPDILRFAHVAVPLADIAPNLIHPESGQPLAAIAERLLAEAKAANDNRPPLWPRPDISLIPDPRM